MKNIITLLILLISASSIAQVPNSFSFRSTVFKNDSIPLKNQNILVEIEIRNSNSIDAKIQYAEYFEMTTNERGSYALQIGAGTPTGDFINLDDVDWMEGNKYVLARVYDESNELISEGQSQLMAVPYALVANQVVSKSATSSHGILNLDELREVSGMVDGDIAYVVGHTNYNDQGGGYFYFNEINNDDDDDGMTIDPNLRSTPPPKEINGRWERINYREVSIAFFGAQPNSDDDQTDIIQKAIDYVEDEGHGGGVVYFPKGYYRVTQIILRDDVSLHGEYGGYDGGTDIRPYNDTENALVILDPTKPVRNIEVKNFSFTGNVGGEANMHCFAFNSDAGPGSPSEPSSGSGIWESSFQNIKIRGFKQNGIRLAGGTGSTVNQFLSFINVRVIKSIDQSSSRALYMSGQNGQITFTDCTFSGPKFQNEGGEIGTNIEIIVPDDPTPFTAIINFNTCTIEEAEVGVRLTHAQNINFNGCWFENVENGIVGTNECKSINIANSRFLNIGKDVSGAYVFKLTAGSIGASYGTFSNNLFRGSTPTTNYLQVEGGSQIIEMNTRTD